jgi:hypothetical protein
MEPTLLSCVFFTFIIRSVNPVGFTLAEGMRYLGESPAAAYSTRRKLDNRGEIMEKV